jgi:hypothetical protein
MVQSVQYFESISLKEHLLLSLNNPQLVDDNSKEKDTSQTPSNHQVKDNVSLRVSYYS